LKHRLERPGDLERDGLPDSTARVAWHRPGLANTWGRKFLLWGYGLHPCRSFTLTFGAIATETIPQPSILAPPCVRVSAADEAMRPLRLSSKARQVGPLKARLPVERPSADPSPRGVPWQNGPRPSRAEPEAVGRAVSAVYSPHLATLLVLPTQSTQTTSTRYPIYLSGVVQVPRWGR
jgi:hypothetical protein